MAVWFCKMPFWTWLSSSLRYVKAGTVVFAVFPNIQANSLISLCVCAASPGVCILKTAAVSASVKVYSIQESSQSEGSAGLARIECIGLPLERWEGVLFHLWSKGQTEHDLGTVKREALPQRRPHSYFIRMVCMSCRRAVMLSTDCLVRPQLFWSLCQEMILVKSKWKEET